MAQALPAGTPIRRKRALMGLVAADGWAWAGIKAAFWFILIILLLGYIPDRAYYFTVNRTIDLGLLAWSPVNFCPPENKDLPCPAPLGSVIPWDEAESNFVPPAGRIHASAAQLGTRLVLAGGSDGAAPTATTWISELVEGTYQGWTEGPALPEPRTGASLVVIGSSAYLVGGADADGAPTDTIWQLPVDPETSELGEWTTVEGLALPAPRAGAAALAVADGLLVAGGRGEDDAPVGTVWKWTLNKDGIPANVVESPALLTPVADASIAQVGDYIWVYGGSNADGPVGVVQRGAIGAPPAETTPAPNATPVPTQLLQWAGSDAWNLPGARTSAAGFAANGVLYIAGGTDGSGPRSEVYWTVPTGGGSIDGWKHLEQTDLAEGLEGATPIVVGSNAYLLGGQTQDGLATDGRKANLAPQAPFFQAGLVGVVVPALKIEGEIGQQLGYLNAAGAGTVNFIILLLIGWAFAHKAQVRGWFERRRARRRARET